MVLIRKLTWYGDKLERNEQPKHEMNIQVVKTNRERRKYARTHENWKNEEHTQRNHNTLALVERKGVNTRFYFRRALDGVLLSIRCVSIGVHFTLQIVCERGLCSNRCKENSHDSWTNPAIHWSNACRSEFPFSCSKHLIPRTLINGTIE